MPETVNSMLDRFQLTRVNSLPSLILHGLNLPDESNGRQALVALLEDDIFLYAKVIGSFHQVQLNTPFDPAATLAIVGRERVQALISQAAIQSSYRDPSPEHLDFFHAFWEESCLSSELAKGLSKVLKLDLEAEAGFSARFLGLGKLVLEGLFSEQYRILHTKAKSQSSLLLEEIEQFGASHAELGGELLRRWGIDGFVCDALLYQHEGLKQILDASKLVKICWLAHAVAIQGAVDDEIELAGEALFDLSPEALKNIYLSAEASQQHRLKKFEAKADSVQRQINEQVQNISLFNAVGPKFQGASGSVKEVDAGKILGETLSLFFGFSQGIVFKLNKSTSVLETSLSSIEGDGAEEFQIQCLEGRSMIANSFLSGKKIYGKKDDKTMTVIDKQVLSLMGASTLICDPIYLNGIEVGVLVLGAQQTQNYEYGKQVKLRDLLKSEIARGLVGNSSEQVLNSNAVHKQRINEAIHEANNPLSIIKNYLQLLSIKEAGKDSVLEDINIIRTEIDRVSAILKNLQKDDSVHEQACEEVEVNKIIESLNKVFMASIFSEKSLLVELELEPNLPLIFFQKNALKQILTNVLKNAAEALPKNGKIIIKSFGNIFMNNKHYVQIIISDNGPGISASAMNSLFLPGNSTKGDAHSGVGLAISKDLIESMHGQIFCQSNTSGTSFSLLFPVSK